MKRVIYLYIPQLRCDTPKGLKIKNYLVFSFAYRSSLTSKSRLLQISPTQK